LPFYRWVGTTGGGKHEYKEQGPISAMGEGKERTQTGQ